MFSRIFSGLPIDTIKYEIWSLLDSVSKLVLKSTLLRYFPFFISQEIKRAICSQGHESVFVDMFVKLNLLNVDEVIISAVYHENLIILEWALKYGLDIFDLEYDSDVSGYSLIKEDEGNLEKKRAVLARKTAYEFKRLNVLKWISKWISSHPTFGNEGPGINWEVDTSERFFKGHYREVEEIKWFDILNSITDVSILKWVTNRDNKSIKLTVLLERLLLIQLSAKDDTTNFRNSIYWLVKKLKPYDQLHIDMAEGVCAALAGIGVDALKLARSKEWPWNELTIINAINIETFQYALENGCPLPPKSFRKKLGIQREQHKLIEWMINQGYPLWWENNIIYDVARYNPAMLPTFIDKGYPIDDRLIAELLARGNLPMLDYLWSKSKDESFWNKDLWEVLMANCDCFEWLLVHNIKIPKFNNLAIKKIKPDNNNGIINAVMSGNVEMVRWWLKKGFCWERECTIAAARHTNTLIFELVWQHFWISSSGTLDLDLVCAEALRNDHFSLLMWAFTKGAKWKNKYCMIPCNSYEIYHWVMANGYSCPPQYKIKYQYHVDLSKKYLYD